MAKKRRGWWIEPLIGFLTRYYPANVAITQFASPCLIFPAILPALPSRNSSSIHYLIRLALKLCCGHFPLGLCGAIVNYFH